MALIDEFWSGPEHRRAAWEERTDVTFFIAPANGQAVLITSKVHQMPQTPIFGNLDQEFVDPSRRNELLKLLSEGVVEVTFLTQDKQTKTIMCTTHESFIPLEQRPKQKKPQVSLQDVVFTENLSALNIPTAKPVDQNLFKVYSTDRQAWRSFRFDRVKSFHSI